jgi:iron complex transport system ATP-binding protein
MALGHRRSREPERVAPGAILLEATGVEADLGGRQVVGRVDLGVRAGEVVALVGPNGAGKSTLLHVLAGDLVARAGTIRLAGQPVGEWTTRELAMRRAVLPQQTNIGFPFTVRDVVSMGRAPWAGTIAEDLDDEAVEAALREADVVDLASRPVPALSGGERARVSLARVLAQSAQLLLLDEPTAALDIRHQELVLATARRRARHGDAVVVVLHDLRLATRADRVVVLERGAGAADGPPDAVLTAELVSRVYQHEVDVVTDPRTGQPLVVPRELATDIGMRDVRQT